MIGAARDPARQVGVAMCLGRVEEVIILHELLLRDRLLVHPVVWHKIIFREIAQILLNVGGDPIK